MFEYSKPKQKPVSKDSVQKKEAEKTSTSTNRTGIPDTLKSQFEDLSKLSFNDVRVHYNSGKPAQLQALAYTKGNQVYIAPGEEKHLGHELGHVVQQKQGKVKPNLQFGEVNINDDRRLENEATALGKRAEISVNTVQMMARKDEELRVTAERVEAEARLKSGKKSHKKHMIAGGKIAPKDVDSFDEESIAESSSATMKQAQNRIENKYDDLLEGLTSSKPFSKMSKKDQDKAVAQL